MAEKRIETFAFVDIETSGLPVYNYEKTSIAEISIQSSSKEDIIDCNKNEIPRCFNKLVLCFNPRKRIHPNSTKFTGLDNFMLENYNSLNEKAAELIVKFFQSLRQPVCLVSHYGNGHDYKIINTAFQKLKMALPEEILCVDSLLAFKYIDDRINKTFDIESDEELEQWLEEEFDNTIKKAYDATPKRTILAEDLINKIHQQNDSENMESLTQQRLEEAQSTAATLKPKENDSGANSTVVTDSFDEITNVEKINVTTPNRPTKLRLSSKVTLKNSDNSSRTERKDKVKRELFPPKTNLKPYQLSSIYERCFGEKPKAVHRADDDVTTLLKVVVFHGGEFVRYSQLYAKPISSVPALGREL